MKSKLLLLASLALAPFLLFGQTKSVKNFYQKYATYENANDITLQGWVLKLASRFADEEGGEKLLQKITKLRVLTMENGNLVKQTDFRNLLDDVKKDSFDDLMEIRDGTARVNFLIREKGDTITDVLILVNDIDSFVLLSLEGALKFSDLQNINIEVEGAEQFKKLPKEKSKIPQA